MFKFFANLTRTKKYLIVTLLGLILFSAGLAVALEIQSRNLASKQPVVAPLEIPAPVVAETPAPAPTTQIATKVATTKKPAPKAPAPKPPKFIPKPPVNNANRLIVSPTNFTIEPGQRLYGVVNITAPGGIAIFEPQEALPFGTNTTGVGFWVNDGGSPYYRSYWSGAIYASLEAKVGTYQIEISSLIADNKFMYGSITIEVVERPTFFANAYRVGGTPPGSFSVIFSAIRKFGFSDPISMDKPYFVNTNDAYLDYHPTCEPLIKLSPDSYQLNCLFGIFPQNGFKVGSDFTDGKIYRHASVEFSAP